MRQARSQEELNAEQFGATAGDYVQSPVHSAGADLRQIAEIAKGLTGKLAVDLGSGGGHVTYAVAPSVETVTAYDLSVEMIRAVASEAARRGLANVRTQQGAAEALPFADASFDAVFSRLSAHHWPDLRRGLREARRVLKADGIAVFSDVVAPEHAVLDTFLQTFEMLRDPSHVRDYSVGEWVEFFAQAGFAVTGITRRRLSLDFVSWLQRQRTPEVQAAAIRALFDKIAEPVRQYFAIQPNYDFTLDEVLFELQPV